MKNISLLTIGLGLFISPLAHAIDASELKTRSLHESESNQWTIQGFKSENQVFSNASTTEEAKLISKSIFANFVLSFEFQSKANSLGGVCVQYQGQGDLAKNGIVIPLVGATSGSLSELITMKAGALRPETEWNKVRVFVSGNMISAELNGEKLLTEDLDGIAAKHPENEGLKRDIGHFAFFGKGISFRNINVAEIRMAANDAGVKAAGFEPLFDGSSLKGWKTADNSTLWLAQNDILKFFGTESTAVAPLWTEKSYQDFSLVFDWRWSDENATRHSGICLRGSEAAQIEFHNQGSGSLSTWLKKQAIAAAEQGPFLPLVKADTVPGVWNRAMITVRGEQVTFIMNGQKVLNQVTLKGLPAEGPVGLIQGNSGIDFANIWIKQEKAAEKK